MRNLIIFILTLALPVMLMAAEPKHKKTAEDQECSDCHTTEATQWQDGKHGLMNVKCAVCHGSPEKNFVAKPDIYRCRGCHREKVDDVEKILPKGARKCGLCHTPHSVESKFHKEGGK